MQVQVLLGGRLPFGDDIQQGDDRVVAKLPHLVQATQRVLGLGAPLHPGGQRTLPLTSRLVQLCRARVLAAPGQQRGRRARVAQQVDEEVDRLVHQPGVPADLGGLAGLARRQQRLGHLLAQGLDLLLCLLVSGSRLLHQLLERLLLTGHLLQGREQVVRGCLLLGGGPVGLDLGLHLVRLEHHPRLPVHLLGLPKVLALFVQLGRLPRLPQLSRHPGSAVRLPRPQEVLQRHLQVVVFLLQPGRALIVLPVQQALELRIHLRLLARRPPAHIPPRQQQHPNAANGEDEEVQRFS